MKKVAVFGNAGGGKSTLAKRLAERTGLPLYPVDMIQFRAGGGKVPHGEYLRAHAELLARDRWIIDGFGCVKSAWERFASADTLVYVDLPLFTHFLWITKRLIRGLFVTPEGWPEGSPMLSSTLSSYRVLWLCHRHLTPKYRDLVLQAAASKRVHHLRSASEVGTFLEEVEREARSGWLGTQPRLGADGRKHASLACGSLVASFLGGWRRVNRREFNGGLIVPELLCHLGEDDLESSRTADAPRVLTEQMTSSPRPATTHLSPGSAALGLSALLLAVFPIIRPFFPLDPRAPGGNLVGRTPSGGSRRLGERRGHARPPSVHHRPLTRDASGGVMAPVRLIEYADASPDVRAVYDDIMATRKTDWINNFWKALANDPQTLRRIWQSVKEVMAPGALDPLTKEMLYVTVSVTNGCEYCMRSHTAAARRAGMTDAMFAEVLAVVGLANQTNALANGYGVEVDAQFR